MKKRIIKEVLKCHCFILYIFIVFDEFSARAKTHMKNANGRLMAPERGHVDRRLVLRVDHLRRRLRPEQKLRSE